MASGRYIGIWLCFLTARGKRIPVDKACVVATHATRVRILEHLHEAIDNGSYDSAIELARSALTRKPRLDVSILLGKALMYAGRGSDASAVLEDVVAKAARDDQTTVVASALDS